jgi:pyruvate,orthophosphate dikinase
MAAPNDICSLDYLVGTLATAYKGVITSLVVKDFCMTVHDKSVTLKGTVLSMPGGDYQACLMYEGRELSRVAVERGFFELTADAELVQEAKNLQIDVIQGGRHIGTFLLKKEKPRGFFSSAMELSEELKGTNFKNLTAYVQDRPGLLTHAEAIVSKILSTKKDWRRLSEEINGFADDLFWYDREAFYHWYEVFVRFAVNACEGLQATGRDKAVSNVLSLLELSLHQEPDETVQRRAADTWLREVTRSTLDFAYHAGDLRKLLVVLPERFPDLDLTPVLKNLLTSMKRRITRAPTISDADVNSIMSAVTPEDSALLSRYGEAWKRQLVADCSKAVTLLESAQYSLTLERIGSIDARTPDERKIMDTLFDVVGRTMTPVSAQNLSGVLLHAFPTVTLLAPDAYERAMVNTAGVIKKLLSFGRSDICGQFLARIQKGLPALKQDILLNPEVAASILHSGDGTLIDRYTGLLRQILIPSPGVTGFSSETWAEIANPLHLRLLTKFLAVLRTDSEKLRDVLIHVVCNLSLSGVFIPDDRIFQREISTYLNADTLRRDFLLNYLLLKKLPVYYNEVGATGRVRDHTTEIDSWGNDPVLYFLRKQVHVNASNYNVRLVEAVIRAWVYNNRDLLTGAVPDDVLYTLNGGLLARYASAVNPVFLSLGVLDSEGLHLEGLLSMGEEDIRKALMGTALTDEISRKILLICTIYQEVTGKYSHAAAGADGGDPVQKLKEHIDRLGRLKQIILSPEKTSPMENLFFKRHIAFGIPSVLGSYHEPKFDALGETFRVEAEVRVLLEKIIALFEEKRSALSPKDVAQAAACLDSLSRLFTLHGLENFQVDELVTILQSDRLRLSQIVDLLRIWQRELTWMVESFSRMLHGPLASILENFPHQELPDHIRSLDLRRGDFADKAVDIIIRDMLNDVAGFVELDRLLNVLINALDGQAQTGRDGEFTPPDAGVSEKASFALDELSDQGAMQLARLIGSKAKNLMYLRNRGLLVPFAVVFRADRTPAYEQYTESEEFRSALSSAVGKLEERTGRIFGGKKRPLFLSVRSGSYLSMPGILSSILYCGMNRETLAAFITDAGNSRLPWDSYRRFVEHYAVVVHGLEMKIFEDIIGDVMKAHGVARREDLTAGRLEEIVGLSRKALTDRNLSIPDDVYEQARQCVKAVYRSWYGARAEQFRKALKVSEHWGTAVTLMEMIFANDAGSGASVFFTRALPSMERGIYGETREMATGDDLVYGGLANRPLSKRQVPDGRQSLEEIDPGLFSLHETLGEQIEAAMGGLPQEVEAAYRKKPDGARVLYVLQTRRMEFHRGFIKRFEDVCRMESNIIGRGAGVQGGALSGAASFSSSPEEIRKLRQESGLPVILLRKTASTDDVSLMSEIGGIITAAGGVTSHAAVLAQKFGIAAVVGCPNLEIGTDAKGVSSARIGAYEVAEGSLISMDGSTGLVYSGICRFTTERRGL